MTIRQEFSNTLKSKRKERHLTQEQAAEILNISVRWYQKLEASSEKAKPGLDTVCRLAKLWDFDFAAMLHEDEYN